MTFDKKILKHNIRKSSFEIQTKMIPFNYTRGFSEKFHNMSQYLQKFETNQIQNALQQIKTVTHDNRNLQSQW